MRGDKPGRSFAHSDWRDKQDGVYLGTTNREGVTYHRYQLIDRYWRPGDAVLELGVPMNGKTPATITRAVGGITTGKVAYVSVSASENYRMDPAQILIEKGLMSRPSPTENYDNSKQHLISTEYPCLICVRLSEHGEASSVMIGRQLPRTEWPHPKWSTWSWEYPDKYQWVGTEAIRRNLDQVEWWCEWSENHPLVGDIFPSTVTVRRALLAPGYVFTVAVDLVTFPVMFPYYIVCHNLNWHE